MRKNTLQLPLIIIVSALLPLLFSCKDSQNPKLLTEKIEYDVNIINPESNNSVNDWWVQNLEGSTREHLINSIIDGAKSGKFKVYDYGNNQITGKELEAVFKQPVTYTVPGITDPDTDSIITTFNEIDKRDITKIIFLEEWYFDENSLNFTKKVLGLGPVLSKYIIDFETGERILKGHSPLFWIYLDDRYPARLRTNI